MAGRSRIVRVQRQRGQGETRSRLRLFSQQRVLGVVTARLSAPHGDVLRNPQPTVGIENGEEPIQPQGHLEILPLLRALDAIENLGPKRRYEVTVSDVVAILARSPDGERGSGNVVGLKSRRSRL
jgi:hypothetical protein